jgi:hypothetical protein
MLFYNHSIFFSQQLKNENRKGNFLRLFFPNFKFQKFQVSSVPVNFLINDWDVLAALADVEAAKKREAELRNKSRIR